MTPVTPVPVCGSVNRELSRPFRPPGGGAREPRASAFGLSPGLDSPGPLGRQPVCQALLRLCVQRLVVRPPLAEGAQAAGVEHLAQDDRDQPLRHRPPQPLPVAPVDLRGDRGGPERLAGRKTASCRAAAASRSR